VKGIHRLLLIIVIILVTAGVIFNIPKKAVAPVSPEKVSLGPCTLVANSEIKIYNRPHKEADVFGTVEKGESQVVSAITNTGWYGFDPASAQAANVGVFRNRYISPSDDFSITGDCTSLNKIVSLPVDACYVMADHNIQILSKPTKDSDVYYTMRTGDYVPANATKFKNSPNDINYFIVVDPSDLILNSDKEVKGYIKGVDANFNGKCSNLKNS
jgi:uncharacterized protein YgiM (DUF1202 family)